MSCGTSSLRTVLALWALALVTACSGKSSDDDSATDSGDTQDTADTADSADTADTADTGGFPDSPAPFTVQVEGSHSETISFNSPDCSHRTGSTTFRQFWRGEGHVWVLLVEMFDTFPGETGDFDATQGVRVRLQEEAGGMGGYYDSQFGDNSPTMQLVGFDTEAGEAWGTFTAGTLGDGASGSITLSPTTLPVWCSSLE